MDPNTCRICLTTDSYKLSSLFSIQDGKSYANLVTFSCGIDIDSTDLLPQKICIDCMYQVQSACAIKQKSLDTDLLLRDQLKGKFVEKYQMFQDVTEDDGCEALEEAGEEFETVLHLQSIEYDQEYIIEELIEDNILPENDSRTVGVEVFEKKKIFKKQKVKSKNKKPEEDDYRCFICEKVFDLISAKDLHVKQDHKDIRVCHLCNKRKQTPLALENHLRYHKFGYRFLCNFCGKSFRFKNLLENHQNVEHLQIIKFSCDSCCYETKFKINLERHLKTVHMKQKNYKCDKCNEHEYSTQVGLNLHLYRVHGVVAPVICPDCHQGFTFESELRVHKKHCTGSIIRTQKARPQDAPVDILEKGFRCRICSNVYETRSKWSVHYHHKHKNSNVCEFCHKQMASSTSLFKHIQVQHKNVKKFICGICNKSFGFKHSLESHKNTHTGEKPFSCNLCSFRSGDRSTISKHKKKIHTLEEK